MKIGRLKIGLKKLSLKIAWYDPDMIAHRLFTISKLGFIKWGWYPF